MFHQTLERLWVQITKLEFGKWESRMNDSTFREIIDFKQKKRKTQIDVEAI